MCGTPAMWRNRGRGAVTIKTMVKLGICSGLGQITSGVEHRLQALLTARLLEEASAAPPAGGQRHQRQEQTSAALEEAVEAVPLGY